MIRVRSVQRTREIAVHRRVIPGNSNQSGFFTWLRVLVAAWFVPTTASLASAGLGLGKPRGDAVDLLAVAPKDARLVVAIDDLASAWDSPAIATTLSSVQSLTDLTGTLEAWALLSKQIGLAPNDAAKRLLGRRLLLVSDGEQAGASWAIAMLVDGETAGLLRRNLKAVPRALRDGMPVLAIEGNAFELVVQDVGRRKVASTYSGDARGGDAVVVLGPSSRADLFDAVVRAAMSEHAIGDTMAREKAGWLARALPDGTGAVVVRHDADLAWFVLGATIEGHSIRLNFLRHNPELAAMAGQHDKPWRLAVFDEAAEDSLFAVSESNWLSSEMMPTLQDALGQGVMEKLELPEAGVLGGRTMLMGFGTHTGPLELVGVFETANTTRASIAADRSVARSLSALFEGASFEDFGGLFGEAVRKIDLRPVLRDKNPALLDGLWPEEGPELAWTVQPSQEAGAGDGRGWLVLGLGEQRVRSVAEGIKAGAEDRKHGALPWVSVFEIRPRLLIEQLSGQSVALPPVVGSLGAVERVRAQTLLARPDLLRGGGVIEFAQAKRGVK